MGETFNARLRKWISWRKREKGLDPRRGMKGTVRFNHRYCAECVTNCAEQGVTLEGLNAEMLSKLS